MIKEMMRRPRYVFDRALGVIINSYIIATIVYLVDHVVLKAK